MTARHGTGRKDWILRRTTPDAIALAQAMPTLRERFFDQEEGNLMSLILLVILVLILIGTLPTWPYSSGWGYYPSGGAGLVLLILISIAVGRTHLVW